MTKTKKLVFRNKTMERQMKVGNKDIENVNEFKYLGSLLPWDNDSRKEIRQRLAKALGAMAGFKKCMDMQINQCENKI